MRGKEIFNMSEVFNNNEFTSEPSQQSSNSYPYSFEQPFDAQQQPFAAQPQPSAPVPERKKKSGKAGKIVALLLACALVGGGSGFGAAALMQKNAAAQPQSTTQTSSDASVMLEAKRQAAALQVASVDTGKVLTPSEVYAQNVNSTVGITTSITTNYFGYQTTSAAAGSGFILTQDGYILTNYHVVEGSNSIKVTTYDGTSYDAQLIGYDESNDIAVLKIDASDLTPVVLGDSDTLNVGDSVVAIGNPLGYDDTVTTGIVSALNRPVTVTDDDNNAIVTNAVQIDAAINPGNSGGPTFNAAGQVIGINSSIASTASSSGTAGSIGIGFAIPSNLVKRVANEIIDNGSVRHVVLGITIKSSSVEADGVTRGCAQVQAVTDGGPASKAGVKAGDSIVAFNGKAVNNNYSLLGYVRASAMGDKVKLTVVRGGNTMDLEVTLDQEETRTNSSNKQEQRQQNNGNDDNGNGQNGGSQNGQNGGNGNNGDGGGLFDPFGLW